MHNERFPRTMEEAFGPGHRGNIWTRPEPMHRSDKVVLAGCAAAVVALVVLFWKGWL